MWHWHLSIPLEQEDYWQILTEEIPHCVISQPFAAEAAEVDIYFESEESARAFQAEHGGEISPFDTIDWVSATAPENQPPLLIRQSLVISPSEQEDYLANLRSRYPKREILIFPAEMAFGTGDHATTSTCLRMLCDYAKKHKKQAWNLTDIGCGTGVLALAGVRLGAQHALSFDFDPKAVEIAQRNLERNGGQDPITLFQADVFEWQPQEEQRADIVLANLFSTVLIAAFPRIIAAMKPQGTLIISGILRQQAEETLIAAQSHGLQLEQAITRGKWTTARLTLP